MHFAYFYITYILACKQSNRPKHAAMLNLIKGVFDDEYMYLFIILVYQRQGKECYQNIWLPFN